MDAAFEREHRADLRPGDRAQGLIDECRSELARADAYAREHLEDPPDIANWTWDSTPR
jgi:phosphoketolase